MQRTSGTYSVQGSVVIAPDLACLCDDLQGILCESFSLTQIVTGSNLEATISEICFSTSKSELRIYLEDVIYEWNNIPNSQQFNKYNCGPEISRLSNLPFPSVGISLRIVTLCKKFSYSFPPLPLSSPWWSATLTSTSRLSDSWSDQATVRFGVRPLGLLPSSHYVCHSSLVIYAQTPLFKRSFIHVELLPPWHRWNK